MLDFISQKNMKQAVCSSLQACFLNQDGDVSDDVDDNEDNNEDEVTYAVSSRDATLSTECARRTAYHLIR